MTDVKPSHSAIKKYHADLADYAARGVTHETGVRSAFFHLLELTCPAGWKWVAEVAERAGDHAVRPDATLYDENYLPRGYWEAKDSRSRLDAEIAKKVKKGYPLANTIFEDTRRAVLFQDGKSVGEFDLSSPEKVAALLNDFYGYTHPVIQDFEKAVQAFRADVARLAGGFKKKIDEAHRDNAAFQAAFDGFMDLCRRSVNPNVAAAAVDEMLIQHMFTERLLRTVFNLEDFCQRNVVAGEVEKVITALTSKNFNRREFLGQLDRFYKAIEAAAEANADWTQKRNFITGVYEKFFQGYAVKVADTHGIVYTPAPVVDFMCRSVVRALQDEFGLELGDPGVVVIDPAAGTGSFPARLLELCPRRRLADFYRQRLFANEVLLLPYYVCALNVEHTYYELTGAYEPFDGLCFVDTLGLADEVQTRMDFMTEKNAERVQRQMKAPITVVVGNPPYNVGQLNENDNNKNRHYPAVERRIKDTYAKDSAATNKNALSDAYVKFFRWATDRLGDRDGCVCFVSNNGFLDGVAFDGMRKDLEETFAKIYHFDFKGNARTSGERRRREGGNLFLDQIRVGVGITVLIKKGPRGNRCAVNYHVVGDYWKQPEKTAYLKSFPDYAAVAWRRLRPDARHTWLVPPGQEEFAGLVPLGTKETKRSGPRQSRPETPPTIFRTYCRGVVTCRDDVVYDYDRRRLVERVNAAILEYNSWVYKFIAAEGKPAKNNGLISYVDNFVAYDKLKWSMGLKLHLISGHKAEFNDDKIRVSLYRPFNKRFLFFDRVFNEALYLQPYFFPTAAAEAENRVICCNGLGMQKAFSCVMTNVIPEVQVIYNTQCFPFYVYDQDGGNRRENITDWALAAFRDHYKDKKIAKWDIFHYCYGVLHHPKYRKEFAGCLKRELARVPFAPDFWAFARAGKELAALHVGYDEVEPLRLEWREAPGKAVSFRVEKMRWEDEKKTVLRVNETLTLAGIPREAHEYVLGNRSALDWVVDQYQVKKDKGTGEVTSDPNRREDPQYIVNLVGRVARVSVETVRLVKGLPRAYK